jgi:hypothetical protein
MISWMDFDFYIVGLIQGFLGVCLSIHDAEMFSPEQFALGLVLINGKVNGLRSDKK